MRIAVTGSGGFIGSYLVTQLKTLEHEVVEISSSKGFDLCNWDSVKDIAQCDVLVHLAAKTFVPDSFNNPRDFYQTNTLLTLNSLELARKWKAKVIYMGSYFYGPPQYVPVDETHPLKPHNPYAQTKYLSEELCKAYSRDFDLPVVAFRLFNVYGSGQEGNFLIPEVLKKIKNGGGVQLKDPRPKRDYIHVSDVISAIISAVNCSMEGFNVLNLGTGSSISVGDLVNIIRKWSPIKFEVSYTHEYRKGEVLDSISDISLAKERLCWLPNVSIEDGIKSLVLV